MPSRVWFENPRDYIGQIIESGTIRFVWHRGYLVKHRIETDKFTAILLSGLNYEYLVVDDFGLQHFVKDRGQIAVYPIWSYQHDNINLLEELCANPSGSDLKEIQNKKIPFNERPKLGQAHVIGITDVPSAASNLIKKFYMRLVSLQSEYNVKFYIHDIASYRIAFGLEFWGAGMDPNYFANKGSIILPSGRQVTGRDVHKYPIWTKGFFGQTPHELEGSPLKRLQYNIASMLYSEANFLRLTNTARKGVSREDRDITSPDDSHILPETRSESPLAHAGHLSLDVKDKVNCDTCSLFSHCKYAREGAVCGVPGSEGASLANIMQTRDADTIVDGLLSMQGMLAKRLERKLNMEDVLGEDDPAVEKVSAQLFRQGVELAKLIDPNLRGPATKVQVNVNSGSTQGEIETQDPKQFIARISKELVKQGIPLHKQTPELIERFIHGMSQPVEQQLKEIHASIRTVDADE